MPHIYGTHTVPFQFRENGLTLESTEENGVINYTRELNDETVEKSLVSGNQKMSIQPVEPLNLPKDITSSLLLEFEDPIIIDSEMKKDIFATFPIEVAVFLESRSTDKPLDIFTLAKQKYTLYGDVKTGTICKYWSTKQRTDPPDNLDPLVEGMIDLSLINKTDEWIEVSKVVFDAYGMKLFYDEEKVAMEGAMLIKDEYFSETGFSSKPIEEGMTESREVYRKKNIPTIKGGSKFVMESGL